MHTGNASTGPHNYICRRRERSEAKERISVAVEFIRVHPSGLFPKIAQPLSPLWENPNSAANKIEMFSVSAPTLYV
jgi:hypothetical protein